MSSFTKLFAVLTAICSAQSSFAGIIVVDGPSTIAYTYLNGVQTDNTPTNAYDAFSSATASTSFTADSVTVSASSQSSAQGNALTQALGEAVLYFHVNTQADFNLTETNATYIQSLGALQLNSYALLFQGGVQIASLPSVANGSVSLQGILLPGYEYALRRDSGTNAAAAGSGSISGTAVLTASTPPPPGPSYTVPEPSTCVLLALGSLGMLAGVRRLR